jgi:hypothetical protein
MATVSDGPHRAIVEVAMKMIASALLVISVLIAHVAPAAAYSDSVFERLDRLGRGGHAT